MSVVVVHTSPSNEVIIDTIECVIFFIMSTYKRQNKPNGHHVTIFGESCMGDVELLKGPWVIGIVVSTRIIEGMYPVLRPEAFLAYTEQY
jgi:hypothetical protein